MYGARERSSGAEVAIKMIEKSKMLEHSMVARVNNEILLHTFMQHKNVVKIYNTFEDNEKVYMVMEICRLGNLYKYLKTYGPLTEKNVSII